MRLEHIQRDFLWGGKALEWRPHPVRWGTVRLDKSKGGLGIKSLFSFLKRLFFVHEVGVLLLKERPCGIKW